MKFIARKIYHVVLRHFRDKCIRLSKGKFTLYMFNVCAVLLSILKDGGTKRKMKNGVFWVVTP
jgi:hypothetical protein